MQTFQYYIFESKVKWILLKFLFTRFEDKFQSQLCFSVITFRTMVSFETRWDPIHGYDYTYFPDSKYFHNYRFSPPISWWDDWSHRSRVWFPYYWSTRRLFQHYMDYQPSWRSLREQRVSGFVGKSVGVP